MKKTSRKKADNDSPPIAFVSPTEPVPFYWDPSDLALTAAGADLATVLFDKEAPPLLKTEIRARVDNYWWRLAYPGERHRYAEAVQRAISGDDEMLFKLVCLFGRYIEERPWFAQRFARACQEQDFYFYERYNDARRSPLPFSNKKRNPSRLFILAFFEPELRELQPAAIMRAFQGLVDAGKVPRRVIPPNLNALKQDLDKLGWRRKTVSENLDLH